VTGRRRLLLLTCAAAMIAAVFAPGGARVPRYDRDVEVYASGRLCVRFRFTTRRHAGHVEGRAAVRAYDGSCRRPATQEVLHLAVSFLLWYRGPVQDRPRELCAYTETYYNADPDPALVVTWTLPTTPSCGAGLYEVEARGNTWADDTWHSGAITSPQYMNPS
jgi:hypothetical protein